MQKHFTVLTCCSYPEYEIYRRFTGSLHDTGFTGDIVFLIQPQDEENLRRLQQEYENVQYQVCDNFEYHIQSFRYQLYSDFLRTRSSKEGYVLLCDSKDVLFQRNPEDYPYDKDVDLYLFEESQNIGNCKYTGKWLRIKDKKFFNRVRESQILCSGTTLGTVSGITQYLEIMNKNILADPRSQKGRVYRDQCIHNFIVYGDQLRKLNLKMLSNDDNLVNTMGYGRKHLNEENEIVNERGEVSWICHQYNRMTADQLAQISDKYGFDECWDAPHSLSRVKHRKHRNWLPRFLTSKP